MAKLNEKYASNGQVVAISLLMLGLLPLIAFQSLGVNDRSYSIDEFLEFCGAVGKITAGISGVLALGILIISDSRETLDKAVDFVMWPFTAMMAVGMVAYIFGGGILRLPFLETTGALLVWGFFGVIYMIAFSWISRIFVKEKKKSATGGKPLA